MNGVLIIDKPSGPTSHDVVARVRRATAIKRVGHTGTLDPLASGVLPLVLGRAARLAQFLSSRDKEYDAEIRLGLETDTYDVTGRPVNPLQPAEHISRARVEEVLHEFRGCYLQLPPPFSAKKIGGSRAYLLARRGQRVQPPAAPVVISQLEVTDLRQGVLRLRLTCSAGCYVRSLAQEIGRRLETGGCLQALRRIRSGDFDVDRAAPLDVVERDPNSALRWLVPMSDLLTSLPGIVLTSEGARRAAKGNLIGPAHVLRSAPLPTILGARGARPPLAVASRLRSSFDNPVPSDVRPSAELRTKESPVEASQEPQALRVRLLDERGELVAIAEPTRQPGFLHPGIVVV